MLENSDLQKLINITTIVKVYDNKLQEYIFGEESLVSRFSVDQGVQISLESLEKYWNIKWSSLGNIWTEERQNYRYLYNSFRFFYFSFENLRRNKIACIQESFGDDIKMLEFNNLSGLALYDIYYHGNKCIKLMKKLGLLDENNNFLKKFSGSRNKLIEHNYNPDSINLSISPSIWSLLETNSFLDIDIHEGNQERIYNVYVDYYEDYYKLENILAEVIRNF